MSLIRIIKEKQKERAFNLKGFKLIDLFNPYYIDRKTLYDFIYYVGRKYVRGGALLDFGCGRKPYENLFSCEEYVGCDILESGHNNNDKNADIFYDGHTLPLLSESFDFVLATQVLEHVQYFVEVFGELVRILKKGGIFIITVPFAAEEHEQPYDFRRFTSYGIKNLFSKYGIELLELRRSTNYKETIGFIKCMCSDNRYRQNKNFKNLIFRYFRCIFENLRFVLEGMSYSAEIKDDLTLNFFVIGKK